jgi:antitoxin VapB
MALLRPAAVAVHDDGDVLGDGSHSVCGEMSILTSGTCLISNRSQAVRITSDMRLPEGVKKVLVRARGVERVIAPATQSWDTFFFNGPAVSNDFMTERASQSKGERESFE